MPLLNTRVVSFNYTLPTLSLKWWSQIVLCVQFLDDGKVFWGLIVKRGGEGGVGTLSCSFLCRDTLHLHYSPVNSQHTPLVPGSGWIIIIIWRHNKDCGHRASSSKIVLIPRFCTEQSFCDRFLWGLGRGEQGRVGLPSCLQSGLCLQVREVREGN